MAVLHILNGDLTLQTFQNTNLEGDFIVWRELLSEGPVHPIVDSKPFWEERAKYAQKEWGASGEDYHCKVLFELALLSTFNSYDEIICWFDHDLVCQFNLLALCQWLEDKDLHQTKISLIANQLPSQIPNFYAFSAVSKQELQVLLKNRKPITHTCLKEAAKLWKCYASDDPRSMVAHLSKELNTCFPYLERAIQLHLQRFPSLHNGLNQTENELLKTLEEQAIKSEKVLVQKILAQDNQLGITDLRLTAYIQRLQPLLYQNGQLRLNDVGKKVLEGEVDFMNLKKQESPIHWGGATNKQYRWDQVEQQLVIHQ